MAIPPDRVTTAMGFDGYRIVQHRGVVRGIVVRSRSVVGTLGASIQTLFGGNITLYTELCERARQDAFDLMLRHGAEVGANAIIAMRYDANEVGPGRHRGARVRHRGRHRAGRALTVLSSACRTRPPIPRRCP